MKWTKLGLVVVCVVAAGGVVEAQQQDGGSCQRQTTCGDCIQTPDCMWCSAPNMTTKTQDPSARKVFCRHSSTDVDTFCSPEHLENPENIAHITLQEPLSEVNQDRKKDKEGNDEKIVQITPQRMKLRLRKGVPLNITLTYQQARDYPVDLYYLMDLSNSMSDDKKTLASLGSELANLLASLTSQFTLGFGSFVDKVMMPFADTAPEKLRAPCTGCARPYSFRNDLPLASNATLFTHKVRQAKISGNLDAPEGGFDALMQAMVCDEEIGWRDQARHIIIFSTDAKFHHAGDGRLAGIVKPNDERCHLSAQHEYEAYDQYDYPSIAQINKVSKERNINIIFAVSSHEALYRDLSALIETSSHGLLNADSSNVVDLVRDQYNKISSAVRLTDNSTNSPITVRYFSSCLDADGAVVATKECKGIKEGDRLTFTLEVTANECLEGQKSIVEVKTLQDSLVLEIEYECSCGCDSPEYAVPNAEDCSYQGSQICGVCSCNEGFRGERCQCSSNDGPSDGEIDKDLCIAEGDEKVCSGQGSCSCGTCMCRDSPAVHGTFCECNRRNCLSGLGLECSGKGECDCNECRCHQGYTGDICQCKDDTACIQEGKTEVCSGHGSCDCGKCKCTEQQGVSYTGQFCEDCQGCKSGRCLEFRDCVQCEHAGTGRLSQEACKSCDINPQFVKSLQGQVDANARLCTFEDEEGCYFNFTYRYLDISSETGNPMYEIYVQEDRQCPEEAPVLGIVFGLVAAIVAIGLLTLLIWKIITTIHDRREYAKFERERDNAIWPTEENPIYKGAQTTFQNPAFENKAK